MRVARFLICWALFSVAAYSWAGDGDKPSRLIDPDDGWLDLSQFLDTAYGFVPLVSPITEPAVGYGATAALVFIDRQTSTAQQRYARPNIAAIGAAATENGTRGLFAGHLGTWLDGRLRTTAAIAGADVNLEFFGLGGERRPGDTGLGYAVSARGGTFGGSYRLEQTSLWLGLRYALAKTKVSLDQPSIALPGVTRDDRDLRLGGLTPSLTLDLRDNFFTPTDGWYADLSLPVFREWLGGDRDYGELSLSAIRYQPLARSLFLSIRAGGKSSSDGTPFYLRPYVSLRGVQAIRYQGEQTAEVEAELRWQVHRRFSVVAFAGAGVARTEALDREHRKTVTAGGAGFRYLLARTYGLHMGLDVADGPDKPIFYVVFGHAWLRP